MFAILWSVLFGSGHWPLARRCVRSVGLRKSEEARIREGIVESRAVDDKLPVPGRLGRGFCRFGLRFAQGFQARLSTRESVGGGGRGFSQSGGGWRVGELVEKIEHGPFLIEDGLGEQSGIEVGKLEGFVRRIVSDYCRKEDELAHKWLPSICDR